MRPRTQAAVKLGPFTAGVNRYAEEATRRNIASGLDVLGLGGDLLRRPALRSVATAAPHLLPCGACQVWADYSTPSTSEMADRVGALDIVDAIYVGSTGSGAETFDGIDFGLVALTVAGWTEHHSLEVSFYDSEAGAWTAVPWVLDETLGWDATGEYRCPLTKNGIISWHTAHLTNWGIANVVGATDGFWIRLRILDAAGAAVTFPGTGTLSAPGIRLLHRAPVNGLFPVRIEGQELMVIGSDRRARRGPEAGAMLGVKRRDADATATLRLTLDEGASFYDKITWVSWKRGGTSLGTGGGTLGTTNLLTKVTKEVYRDGAWVPFAWLANEFLGGIVKYVNGSGTATTTSLPGLTGLGPRQYEHCRVRCNAVVTGGLSVGDTREVYFNSATALSLYPALGAAPVDAGDIFEIRRPPGLVLLAPDGLLYEIEANGTEDITVSEQPFARDDAAVTVATFQGHHRILAEPRWVIDAGDRWSGEVDPISRRLLITNGGQMLETDGVVLRPFECDRTSALAFEIVGGLLEDEGQDLDPKVLAKSKLRSAPPEARFMVMYQNRVVVAGVRGRPFQVVWSMPGAANRVWPFAFSTELRDGIANPITGLRVLQDRLIAFTATSIHEALPPDSGGQMSFRPVAQGVGFVSHQAVVELETGSSVLMGVTTSGIAAWDGSEPRIILDAWDRVLDGGVNPKKIHLSTATTLPALGLAFFAVPSAGASVPDRILVVDYRTGAVWPWRAPYGVEALAVDYDVEGRARLLVGTSDGFISTLVWERLDDSAVVTGEAVFRAEQPGNGEEVELTRAFLTARGLGATDTLTVQVFGGSDLDRVLQSMPIYLDRGDPTFGVGTWAVASTWAARPWTTHQAPLRATRLHRFQLGVTGTALWAVRSGEVAWLPRGMRGR